MKKSLLFISALSAVVLISCALTEDNTALVIGSYEAPSKAFNDYWFNSEAEITSYKLEQARYGEIHEGSAVLVYVTEPFSAKKQLKADSPGKEDYSVLKLNFTKKFNTGVYPYSMMNSVFLPIGYPQRRAPKVACSVQEWCGHTYVQLNQNEETYDLKAHSYFENEGDQETTINYGDGWTEDALWTRIRTQPESLPTGENIELIPSLFYCRLAHKEFTTYTANLNKTDAGNGMTDYTINYPSLKRTLTIRYENAFPYAIESWEESYTSGWGANAKPLVTKATKINRIKSAYWGRNSVSDAPLRKELGLD